MCPYDHKIQLNSSFYLKIFYNSLKTCIAVIYFKKRKRCTYNNRFPLHLQYETLTQIHKLIIDRLEWFILISLPRNDDCEHDWSNWTSISWRMRLTVGRFKFIVIFNFDWSIINSDHFIEFHPLCLTEWVTNERLTIAFSSSTKLHEEKRTNEVHPPACWRQKLHLIIFSG